MGNLSLIYNQIKNICDLKGPSYNKLVHGDKNDNFIVSLKCISLETLTHRKKKCLNVIPSAPKKKIVYIGIELTPSLSQRGETF